MGGNVCACLTRADIDTVPCCASEFANAVYHVSCLTGRIQCTNAVFTDFWNNRYAVTRDDGEKFDTWRNVFQSIEGKGPSAATAPLLPNYAGHYPALRLRSLVLQAAFSSRSPAEFEKRARRLMSDDDALKCVLSSSMSSFAYDRGGNKQERGLSKPKRENPKTTQF